MFSSPGLYRNTDRPPERTTDPQETDALADASPRYARGKAGELRISAQPHQHAVNGGGDGIISADAVIQRRHLAFALRRVLIWLPWLCHANTQCSCPR